MIHEFSGDYRFLSNFVPVLIEYKGHKFPSVEHAYQWAKDTSNSDWLKICTDKDIRAGYVKRMACYIRLSPEWHLYKKGVMFELLCLKFSQEPFKTDLMNTGNLYLQEGNNWGDTYWGFCFKKDRGMNVLGKLLMIIREMLQNNELLNAENLQKYNDKHFFD